MALLYRRIQSTQTLVHSARPGVWLMQVYVHSQAWHLQ